MQFLFIIMSQNLTEGQATLFERLDQFISQNEIDLLVFWKTNRFCLTLQQFIQLLHKIGFQVTNHELDLLEKDSVQFVNLETIIKNVQTWRKKDVSVSSFITRQNKQTQELSKSKANKKMKDSRSNTLSSFGDYRDSRTRAAERQWKKETKLNQTLIRTKNESDYELTIKVGQANDICKKLRNDCSFIIDSGDGELKIVEVKTKTGQQIELSRKLFEKRYEQLKTSSLVRTEQVEGTLEEDLKKVLVQVMYLSGQLQQQIQLLQSKGVSH